MKTLVTIKPELLLIKPELKDYGVCEILYADHCWYKIRSTIHEGTTWVHVYNLIRINQEPPIKSIWQRLKAWLW